MIRRVVAACAAAGLTALLAGSVIGATPDTGKPTWGHESNATTGEEWGKGERIAGRTGLEAGKEPCHVRDFVEHGVKEVEAVGECLKSSQTCYLQQRPKGSIGAWSTVSTPRVAASNEEYRPYCK